MLLNQLSKKKKSFRTCFSFSIKTKQLDKLHSVFSRTGGFSPLSVLICVLALLVAGPYESTPCTAVRRCIK